MVINRGFVLCWREADPKANLMSMDQAASSRLAAPRDRALSLFSAL
jgi:hypothetical protein